MSRKSIIILLVILAVLAGGFFVYTTQVNNKGVSSDEVFEQENKAPFNLGDPTEEDKQSAENAKEQIVEDQEASNSDGNTGDRLREVKPLFGYLRQSDTGNVEANGYITETIEETGTCTLTLKKGSETVSVSKKALPDAQSTVCGLLSINASKLSSGQWSTTITYKSPTSYGVSDARMIDVK